MQTMVPQLGSPAEKLTRRMFTRIMTAVARTLQEHDLSVGQLAVLYLLDERATLRVSDVSAELDLSMPTASRLVDDLVRQSLVGRREDPSDRRARTLSLTTEGRAFVAKSSKARMATMAGALAEIPASTIKALWSLANPR
jgi:MarR family transcriptional regulator, transcriptional regulator for hemolysin